jgi:hypothetical protein
MKRKARDQALMYYAGLANTGAASEPLTHELVAEGLIFWDGTGYDTTPKGKRAAADVSEKLWREYGGDCADGDYRAGTRGHLEIEVAREFLAGADESPSIPVDGAYTAAERDAALAAITDGYNEQMGALCALDGDVESDDVRCAQCGHLLILESGELHHMALGGGINEERDADHTPEVMSADEDEDGDDAIDPRSIRPVDEVDVNDPRSIRPVDEVDVNDPRSVLDHCARTYLGGDYTRGERAQFERTLAAALAGAAPTAASAAQARTPREAGMLRALADIVKAVSADDGDLDPFDALTTIVEILGNEGIAAGDVDKLLGDG